MPEMSPIANAVRTAIRAYSLQYAHSRPGAADLWRGTQPNWTKATLHINAVHNAKHPDQPKDPFKLSRLQKICDGTVKQPEREALEMIAEAFETSVAELRGHRGPGHLDFERIIQLALEAHSPEQLTQEITPHDSKNVIGAFNRVIEALKKARATRRFLFTPPFNSSLSHRVRKLFNLPSEVVEVVDVDWKKNRDGEPMIARAAMVAFDHILKRSESKEPICTELGFGVGSGGTVRAVFKHLIRCLAADPTLSEKITSGSLLLKFYPLAASVDTAHSIDDIPSCFIYEALDQCGTQWKALCKNIHATPNRGDKMKSLAWAEANLDFCITSIADLHDPHSMLVAHLHTRRDNSEAKAYHERLKSAIGEVQFRAFDETGFLPTAKAEKILPNTLIDPRDLMRLSQHPNKLVLLVAGKCLQTECDCYKDKPISALLKNPSMRLFNRAVIDSTSAQNMLISTNAAEENTSTVSLRRRRKS